MNEYIQIFPDIKALPHNNFYNVRARQLGSTTWNELNVYEAKVDMHDVRNTSYVNVDFDSPVEFEITFKTFYSVYDVIIHPVSKNIHPDFTDKKISFILTEPMDIAIEINHERFHNLQIFCSHLEKEEIKEELVITGDLERPRTIGDSLNSLRKNTDEFKIRIKAGLYYFEEGLWHVPSNTTIVIEAGAVLRGSFIIENVENVRISGRGIVDLSHVERFTGTNGCRVSHSKNISIENLLFVNPPHYTCLLGESRDILIKSIRSFSCEGWSDGIDMMSCQNVVVDGGFIRTSDDCIAIYGSRWNYYGDSRNITVKNVILWADVAHAMMIGTHGDAKKGGDIITDITFKNIEVLEHHEYQDNYLGVMAINVGDGNIAKNISFENINIEHIEHGRVFDIKIMFNKDYNLIPGRGIEDVYFNNIHFTTCRGEEVSKITGYGDDEAVKNITISNYYRDGKLVDDLSKANIRIGEYVQGVRLNADR